MRSLQRGAMRSVFWLLGLAALAVALALLVGRNPATLTLFWPPYRFDVSFNFVVFALIAVFVLLHLALRAIAVLRELPAQAQRWRGQQVERAVVGAVMDALSHLMAGRFIRAAKLAQNAITQASTIITKSSTAPRNSGCPAASATSPAAASSKATNSSTPSTPRRSCGTWRPTRSRGCAGAPAGRRSPPRFPAGRSG